jgi:DNA-binding NarL/FixJ family response regulator
MFRMLTDSKQDELLVSIILSDVSRMRCELLAAQLTRKQPRFQVVGHGVSVEELLASAGCSPHVAIISGALRDGPVAGYDALRELHADHPNIRTIMLLDHCEQDLVLAAFRGGARGVFPRSASVEELIKCVERVSQGQIWAGNTELEYLLNAISTLAPLRVPPLASILNRREEQIAALVATGATQREIGRKLNLTEHALSEALARIFTKLGIQSRVELVLAVNQQNGRGPRAHSTYPETRTGNGSSDRAA